MSFTDPQLSCVLDISENPLHTLSTRFKLIRRENLEDLGVLNYSKTLNRVPVSLFAMRFVSKEQKYALT